MYKARPRKYYRIYKETDGIVTQLKEQFDSVKETVEFLIDLLKIQNNKQQIAELRRYEAITINDTVYYISEAI